MNIKWPRIFSEKQNIEKQFIDVCTKQYLKCNIKIGLDREYPRITKIKNKSYYAIWNGGASCLQSAWNDEKIIQGAGWVDPTTVNESDEKLFFGKMVDIPWNEYKSGFIKKNKKIKKVNGNYVAFHTWWHDNYGHNLHDNLPYLLWLVSNVPSDYKILMLESSIKKEIISNIDVKLYNRIKWIKIGDTIEINGDLIVSTPDCHPCIMGKNFMKYFKNWIKQNSIESFNKDVIFYSRRNTTNRRVLEKNNEKLVIKTIKELMLKHKIRGELVIFSGKDENNDSLSVSEQIKIFKNADTIIGPHGTGLINMLYANLDKVKILEFIPSCESASVQRPFNGYHNVLHGLEMNYNHILYTDDSTINETKIKYKDLKNALNTMWGEIK